MTISFTTEELDILEEALSNYLEVTEDALEYDGEIMPIEHRIYLLQRVLLIRNIDNKLFGATKS